MSKKCERLRNELSIRRENPKPFSFFDTIKPRRKEYLPIQYGYILEAAISY